jgi:predicted ATPase/DNA-binding CsgD family transcriptional regulator
MLTLLGPGGVGKTALAAEAVRRHRKATSAPIYWVRLDRLGRAATATAVVEEVARAVLQDHDGHEPLWETVVNVLTGGGDVSPKRSRPVVVMDNCEHVLDGAGAAIVDMLAVIPGLTILATSREPLGWIDEHLLIVPPLTREQAVMVFTDRAQLTANPVRGPKELALVREICRRVHDNPLYVRLAAARLRHQPLTAIARELSGDPDDQRLMWSHGARLGGDTRHRGILDVIAWSYELCNAKERLLLDRMSVFASGYDVNPEAIEPRPDFAPGVDLETLVAVCADEASIGETVVDSDVVIHPGEVAGLLERLVDRSLVIGHRTESVMRYSLLESIRIFARRQLDARSDQATKILEARHRRYFRDRVTDAKSNWYGPDEKSYLNWASSAWDDLVVAIESSFSSREEAIIGLEICTGLIALRVPFFRGVLREIRRLTERTLEVLAPGDAEPTALQVEAQALIAWVALCQGDCADAMKFIETCSVGMLDDPEGRQVCLKDSETDTALPPVVTFVHGVALMLIRRDPRAVLVLGRAREAFHKYGDRGGEAMSELLEALAAGLLGPARAAIDISARHLDNATRSGALWAISWAELARAVALTKQGDPDAALAIGRKAMSRQLAIKDRWGALWAASIRSWSLARIITDLQGTGSSADRLIPLAMEIAHLSGTVAAARSDLDIRHEGLGPFMDETKHAVKVANGILGERDFASAEAAGRQFRSDSVAPAKGRSDDVPEKATGSDDDVVIMKKASWQELTAAEQQVAILAAAGLTNAAIAARRGSSAKTIDAQMTSIFQKLWIKSRRDIIRFVPAEEMLRVHAVTVRNPRRDTMESRARTVPSSAPRRIK